MIVYSFDEAKPIILANSGQHKKIGHIAVSGKFHNGYSYCCDEVKKHTEFTMCLHSGLKYVGKWGSIWHPFGMTIPSPSKIKEIDTSKEAEKKVDLVIMGEMPDPPTDKDELAEIKEFTKTHFMPFYREFGEPLDLTQVKGCLQTGFFSAAYYIKKNYFPVDVRLHSYKDGVWRFMQEFVFSELGCSFKVVKPFRDNNGLAYGNSNNVKNNFITQTLGKISNPEGLIYDKNETQESLQNRLDPYGWEVMFFRKYTGPLLENHKDEGDTYIYISLRHKETFEGYTDGFIL